MTDTKTLALVAEVEMTNNTRGCHCDLDPGMTPDYCWIDEGAPSNCCIAIKLLADGKGRNDCQHWRPAAIDTKTAALVAEVERLTRELADAKRRACPNLSPVINWLENGCDPKEAAKELRIYQAKYFAAMQGTDASATSPKSQS